MFKSFLAVGVLVLTLYVSEVQAIPDDGNRASVNPYAGDALLVSPKGVKGGPAYRSDQTINNNMYAGDALLVDPKTIKGSPEERKAKAAGGGGNNGGKKKSSKEAAAEKGEKIKEKLKGYVVPTSTKNFSLGNLNSDNEASLIISTGNEENNVIYRVIRLIAMLVGTVAILLYIVAGYFMIFSQGDENQLTKGKQILTFTSLGLVIVFGAYMLVQLVMGLTYFAS